MPKTKHDAAWVEAEKAAARRDFAAAMRAQMSPEEKEALELEALERDIRAMKDREQARRDFARALAEKERWQRAERSRSAEVRMHVSQWEEAPEDDGSAAAARERMRYRQEHAAEGSKFHPQYGRTNYSGYAETEEE